MAASPRMRQTSAPRRPSRARCSTVSPGPGLARRGEQAHALPGPTVVRADKHAEPFWQPNEIGGHLNEDYFGGDLKGIQLCCPTRTRWRGLPDSNSHLRGPLQPPLQHRRLPQRGPAAGHQRGTLHPVQGSCCYGIGIVLTACSATPVPTVTFQPRGSHMAGGRLPRPNPPTAAGTTLTPKYKGGYRSWWLRLLPRSTRRTRPMWSSSPARAASSTPLRRGAAGFCPDAADEPPDAFIEKIRAAVGRGQPGKIPAGRSGWRTLPLSMASGHRRTYLLGKGRAARMNYPFKNAVLTLSRASPPSRPPERSCPSASTTLPRPRTRP